MERLSPFAARNVPANSLWSQVKLLMKLAVFALCLFQYFTGINPSPTALSILSGWIIMNVLSALFENEESSGRIGSFTLNINIIIQFFEACRCFIYPCENSSWARFFSPTLAYLLQMLTLIIFVIFTGFIPCAVLVQQLVQDLPRASTSPDDHRDSSDNAHANNS